MGFGEGEQCRINDHQLGVIKATTCSISALKREVATLRATRGSGIKQCYEDARAFQLEKERKSTRIRDLNHLRTLVKQSRLVRLQSTAYYNVIVEENGKTNIGEYDPNNKYEYAVLHPHTANLVFGLAKRFYEKFRAKLSIVSVTRTIQYVDWMKSGRRINGRWIPPNKNTAKDISTHEFGCSIDIRYRELSVNQRLWLKAELQRLACAGHVRAVQEGKQPVFHIMDRMIGNPYGPSFVAQSPVSPRTPFPAQEPAPTPTPSPSPLPKPRPPEDQPSVRETLPFKPELARIAEAIRRASRKFRKARLNPAQIQAFTNRVADYLKVNFPREPKLKPTDSVALREDRFGVYVAFRRQGDQERKLRLQLQ